jgi:dienelactone hydrolase
MAERIQQGNITIFPRISDDGKTVYRPDGYSVQVPQGYDRSKKYPSLIVVHGVGELGNGTYADIMNVTFGFDYDGPGPLQRQYAISSDEFKAAIDQYGFIGIVVNYSNEFNPTDFDAVMNEVEKNFAVDLTREGIIGFSLGGGAILRDITSSLARAKRWVVAVACAPVNWATDLKNVRDANLQLIGITGRTDPRVDPSNIKGVVAALNAMNPATPADLIILPYDGHTGLNEMLARSHPNVPQNIYEYIKSVSTDERRPYPTNTSTGQPPVITPPPAGNTKAVTSFTLAQNTARLIGSKSTGYQSGLDGSWSFISGPIGATAGKVFPTGSSYIDATATLPAPGTYVFRFNLKGTDSQLVTVQYGQAPSVPRAVADVDWAGKKVTFNDGSDEVLVSIKTSVKDYQV